MTEKIITLDNIKVRYVVHGLPKGKGRVLILPGFTEFIEKHQSQIDGFAAMGLDVLVIDLPGQGLSTRLINNNGRGNPHRVHSPGFQLYLRAIRAVLDDAGWLNDQMPLMMFGHSMGGHLALRLAHDLKRDGLVESKGVMLSAPMIMVPVTSPRIKRVILGWICRLGFAKLGVPGRQGFVTPDKGFPPLNIWTRDPDGYMLRHRFHEKNPKLKAHGPTFGWVRAALISCFATTRNKKWMRAFDCPVQAHLASDEQVVHPTAAKDYLEVMKDAEIYLYDEARHDLMLELPEVRQKIWARLAQFVERCLNA